MIYFQWHLHNYHQNGEKLSKSAYLPSVIRYSHWAALHSFFCLLSTSSKAWSNCLLLVLTLASWRYKQIATISNYGFRAQKKIYGSTVLSLAVPMPGNVALLIINNWTIKWFVELLNEICEAIELLTWAWKREIVDKNVKSYKRHDSWEVMDCFHQLIVCLCGCRKTNKNTL